MLDANKFSLAVINLFTNISYFRLSFPLILLVSCKGHREQGSPSQTFLVNIAFLA